MRKNFGPKPWTYPQPVLILATYGEDGAPDAMNAAWGGISEASEISVCISEGHKTTANILARKAFTISMATAEQLVACDYVGIASGNTEPRKLEKAGWHTTRSEFVDAETTAGSTRTSWTPSPSIPSTPPTGSWGKRWATPSRMASG